eukprot:gene5719-11548_t
MCRQKNFTAILVTTIFLNFSCIHCIIPVKSRQQSKSIIFLSKEKDPVSKPQMESKSIPRPFLAITSVLVAAICGISVGINQPFDTCGDIPSNYFKEQRTIDGKVLKVSDGDTYRIRHTPSIFSNGDVKGPLTDRTIVVRIAAVDTPETAKFGNEGQPLGKKATEFAKSRLLNKKVSVKLLSKDQYGRVIGLVSYKEGIFTKDISEELLKNGLGVIYRQKGAQYGKEGYKKWESIEKAAKKKRVGIWGQENPELPSDYKKKVKASHARNMIGSLSVIIDVDFPHIYIKRCVVEFLCTRKKLNRNLNVFLTRYLMRVNVMMLLSASRRPQISCYNIRS